MKITTLQLLASSTETVEEDTDNSSGGWWPNWEDLLSPLRRVFADAGEKMDRVTSTISDVVSGKFLKDAIDNVFVLWADEVNRPLYEVFSKVYLFTPRMGSIEFVRGLWSFFSIIGLILLIVGIAVLARHVVRGKKEMKSLLKIFVIALFSSLLSLTILNIIQVLTNWIIHTTVEGVLETTDINYANLGGEDILKAIVVGTDALTDPEFASFTLGELIKDQGGVMTLLLYGSMVIFPLYLISVLKIMVLIAMTVGVPGWIVYSAYTGKAEPLIGFLNLYVRSLLLGGIITLHWTLFVKAQTEYMNGEGFFVLIGLEPVQAAPMSMIPFYVLFYFLWLRPMWRALRDPIALNGGEALEKAGNWSEKASLSMQAIGKRLGSEMMQRKGLNFSQAAKKMQQTGQRMQEMSRQSLQSKRLLSKVTGGASEALAGVKYELPKTWSEEAGSIMKVQNQPITYQGAQIKLEPHEVAHKLGAAGFTAAQMLTVPANERKDMQKMLDTGLQTKYGSSLSYQAKTGQLIVSGQDGQAALRELREAHFTMGQAQQGHLKEGVFVHQDGQVSELTTDGASRETVQWVKDKLPTYTKAELAPDEAKAAYTRLTTEWKHRTWSKHIQLRGNELWIPQDAVGELTPILQKLRATEVKQVRVNMPAGSAFLETMLQDLKQGQHAALVAAIEPHLQGNYVMVPQAQLEAFYGAYEAYRKDRTPYYTTRSYKVKVIADGIPVDYGAAPLNGLNMGAFEALQKEALRKSGK